MLKGKKMYIPESQDKHQEMVRYDTDLGVI